MKKLLFVALFSVSVFAQRDPFSVRTYGPTPGNGATDDSAAIANCLGYARAHGGNCTFPAGDFKTTRTIQITAKPPGKAFADVSIGGLAGAGHAAAVGSAATAGNSTYMHGTRIICAVKKAPCLDVDLSTGSSDLTLYLSGIAFVGPDAGPENATSGDGIKVHGGAEPRMILNDVAVGGFYGPGTWAFDIDGAEGSEFRNLLCQGNNGCFHGFDAFNGNTFTNVASSQTTGPAAFLFEDVDALIWTGGTVQASSGSGIVLHGTAAVTIQGAYFECNNAGLPINCRQPKPTENGAAVVIRGDAKATNQYFTLTGLYFAGDRVVCHSTGGEGLRNVFGTFQTSYMNGTPSPQVSLDASCGHITGRDFSGGKGQVSDAGVDNQFCYGRVCGSGPPDR